MSELFQEQIFINDNNISDIFEQKIQVGAVIQFNLLQKIIEEFIKRQKSLTDKVNNLEIKINSGTARPFSSKMSEDNLLKYFDESNANINNNNLNFEADKEISIKEREDNKENNVKLNEEKEVNVEKKEKEENEEKKVVKEIKDKPETTEKKEIPEKKEKLETKNDKGETADNKKELNNNQYKILSSRIDKFEKILKELTKKVYNFKDNNKDNGENKIDNELIKKQDEKINNLERDINRLNQKVSEMNLLQINFPNDNKENESDDNKSAEIFKIFSKKIELVENRAKQCEEDIFKLKKDNTSINNSLSVIKNNYNEFSKETNKNFSTINQMLNKELSNLKNLMKENDEKIKKEVKDYIDDEIKKVKSMMEEIKSNNMSNSNDSGMNTNLLNSKFNEKLNNLNNDLRNLINKSSSETEKYLKSIINNLPLDNIKKEIGHIYEVLKEKLIKTDLDYIDLKLKEIENRLITETLRLESVEKDMAACNDATTKSVKMIEYLSGQVVQNNQPDMNLEKKTKC
jgi:N-terminal acetyltransferase B complex non-catalytic subunit